MPIGFLLDHIWAVDAAMFSVVLAGAFGAIGLSSLRRRGEAARLRILEGRRADLKRWAAQGREAFERACPGLVRSWNLFQTIQLVKEWRSLLPKEFGPIFQRALEQSGKLQELERIALGDGAKWQRIETLRALGAAGSASSVPAFNMALGAKDEDVAYFAMLSLAEVEHSHAAEVLLDSAGQDSARGQKIASLLEGFKPEVLEEVLHESLQQDPKARYWALKLLVKLKPKGGAERVKEFVRDPSPDVRAAACECLGVMGGKAAEDALVSCLRDEAWFVQMHAVRALANIAAGDHFEDFITLLQETRSDYVKESIKSALAQDMARAVPHIRERLAGWDASIKRFCMQALVEANYVEEVLNGVVSPEEAQRREARELLSLMIRSGVYFGLKRALDAFSAEARKDIVSVVDEINPGLAAQL